MKLQEIVIILPCPGPSKVFSAICCAVFRCHLKPALAGSSPFADVPNPHQSASKLHLIVPILEK